MTDFAGVAELQAEIREIGGKRSSWDRICMIGRLWRFALLNPNGISIVSTDERSRSM